MVIVYYPCTPTKGAELEINCTDDPIGAVHEIIRINTYYESDCCKTIFPVQLRIQQIG